MTANNWPLRGGTGYRNAVGAFYQAVTFSGISKLPPSARDVAGMGDTPNRPIISIMTKNQIP
jgi:hypothetical protein